MAEADTAQTASAASAAEEETSVPTEEAAADGWVYTPISYPLEDGGTLSYYMIKDLSQKSVLGSWQEHPMLKVIQEKTGVTLDITAVSQTNGTDMMNLMLASGDFTDLIESLTYATGFASAMDDDIVREIGDLLEDYAPDYNKLLVENPDYKKSITSDDGRIGIFATITQGSRGPSAAASPACPSSILDMVENTPEIKTVAKNMVTIHLTLTVFLAFFFCF